MSLWKTYLYAWANARKWNLPYTMKMRLGGKYSPDTFFFVISPKAKHPGLADRLKAIIDCYNVAKMNGYKFRIVFKEPFALEDYLAPNKVDWVADYEDLHYVLGRTRFYDEMKLITEDDWKGRTNLRSGMEYHCYAYVGNRQPRTFPESGYLWTDLFQELFKPSQRLATALDGYKSIGGSKHGYIAVHLRFVNALDNFEEVSCYDNTLQSEEAKQQLIERCKEGIMHIRHRHGDMPVMVFSDSKRFLDSLTDLPVIVLDSKNIGHISFGSNDDTTLKTFIDFMMMARAKTIYRIDAPELYAWSGFACVAASAGGVDFLTEKV